MLDIQNFIGKSTTEADRKRDYRKRIADDKKKLGQMSGQCLDKTTPETEQEIDLEIKTEIETELEQQQEIKREDVVGKVKLYMPYLNEKDIEAITNEFLKANKDMYYLSEKLILVCDSKNIENRVGYLIKAIKEDYQPRLVTSPKNLLMVWQQEMIEKPNNPIIADKVNYYKYLSSKNN